MTSPDEIDKLARFAGLAAGHLNRMSRSGDYSFEINGGDEGGTVALMRGDTPLGTADVSAECVASEGFFFAFREVILALQEGAELRVGGP